MPNWAENDLRVTGPADKIKLWASRMKTIRMSKPHMLDILAAKNRGEEPPKEVVVQYDFDFNVGIEMPEELRDIQTGGATINGKMVNAWRMTDGGQNVEVDEAALLKKYGSTNWYDWARENWGTKWNASDVVWENDRFVRFSTAWSPPTPVIVALSKKWPMLTFRMNTFEGGAGYKCVLVVKNGEVSQDATSQYRGQRGG